MELVLETLLGIFTIDKGEIKILLMRKKTEPYKGYWILPGKELSNEETLEENLYTIVHTVLGLPKLYTEQSRTFSALDRVSEKRVIATTYMGLIDNITLYLKKPTADAEIEWFTIKQIPKTAFDHNEIIAKLIEQLKSKIVNSNILRILFPSDFTLPELQHVYEQILEIKLDRRNFRKKLINLGYIEDTGDKNEGYTGRPAKLYRFKEDVEEKNLF